MYRFLLAAFAALWTFALPSLHAQEGKVAVRAEIVPAAAKPGDEVTLKVTLEIADGWHVYGRDEETGEPPSLSLEETGGLEVVGETKLPIGVLHDTFGIQSYWVIGKAVLEQRLKVPATATAGTIDVAGQVDFMVCDENVCLPPDSDTFAVKLTIGDAAAPVDMPDPFGEQDPFGLGGGEQRPEFQTRLEPEVARAGEVVDVIVSVSIPDGWHVYGAKDEDPITLSATAADGLTPHGDNRLPDGREHQTGPLVNHWLAGGFELRQAYRVPDDATPGTHELEFVVDYLQCDENSCLPPAQHEFALPLEVEAGAARPEYDGSAVVSPDGATPKGGWWKLILAAIAAGLFALLMPCTYPMIPITISVFTKQAEARGGKVLPVSLVYGAGIVSTFVLIGVAVGPAIVPFATHWLTNTVIAVFFIVFAFSLFGWITLEPPRFLMNAAGRAQTHGGYYGVLLMGTALVITSFTCTVPFVASLLAVASQGGLIQIIVGMAVFGLTMAIPFVALSLVPGKMRGIPRAGNWMNTLKVFLGFVELAAAMKFVSNVDLVINTGPVWLSRSTFLWTWAVIFVVAAIYLLRAFFVPSEQAGLKRAAGVAVSLALAAYFAYGATGRDLDPIMTAIAPPRDTAKHDIVKDDYQKALADAQTANKLVLVNFTGFT